MVERSKASFILFCIIVFIASTSSNLAAEPDLYPGVEVPIIDSAYNIEQFSNKPGGTKSVNYFVKVEYPATEVLKFYDKRLAESGWVRSSRSGLGKREWQCFIDGTIKGHPKVRQQLALWNNPSLKLEAFLALRYVRIGGDWGNELHVLCQIQPLIDTSRLEEFLRHLDKSGQHAEFMELLDSYRMSNGEVDIDKAVKENPNNDYLKEYKIIVDEIDREMHSMRKSWRP